MTAKISCAEIGCDALASVDQAVGSIDVEKNVSDKEARPVVLLHLCFGFGAG